MLEISTAIGVTGYLFYIGEFVLSLISVIIFGKLIIFHFVMDYFDKLNHKQHKITLRENKNSFV